MKTSKSYNRPFGKPGRDELGGNMTNVDHDRRWARQEAPKPGRKAAITRANKRKGSEVPIERAFED